MPSILKVRPQPIQEKFLRNQADLCIFGGASGGGKTWSLLLEPLYHIKVPTFGAVIFRRTFPQIAQQGGIWDQSCKVYPQLGAIPNKSEHSWKFPSGARVQFAHMQHSTDVFSWQSSEIALIEWDELTHFEEHSFWYMLSRNRSLSGVKPYMRAGCNPDADSWVAALLSWWIDQTTGYPIPERAGKLRWFVRADDRLAWADTAEGLRRKYPDLPPKSLSFVPAKLSDNAALMAADPGYLANLLALPMVERERLLGGNWKIRPAAGLVFNRSWFDLVDVAPRQSTRIRYWDKASLAGKGDWTAGVRMAVDTDGVYWVEDVIRGQWSALERNRVILQTAALDGDDCEIGLEQEPGSGGKESAEISVKQLAGYMVHTDRPTGDKLTRARQFAAQCEARNVKIVRGDWNAAFLDELHGFPEAKNDDQVDSAASGFNRLALSYTGSFDATPDPRARSEWSKAPPGVFLDGDDGDGRDKEWPG
jgi:predicted phage terminase large subunit-like protein